LWVNIFHGIVVGVFNSLNEIKVGERISLNIKNIVHNNSLLESRVSQEKSKKNMHQRPLLALDDCERGEETLAWVFENLEWDHLYIVIRCPPHRKISS
jgi:hypothetical protein